MFSTTEEKKTRESWICHNETINRFFRSGLPAPPIVGCSLNQLSPPMALATNWVYFFQNVYPVLYQCGKGSSCEVVYRVEGARRKSGLRFMYLFIKKLAKPNTKKSKLSSLNYYVLKPRKCEVFGFELLPHS